MGDRIIHSQCMGWKINVQEGMDASTVKMKFHERVISRIFQAFKRWKSCVVSVCSRISQVGADDPRRVIHSIKVGLALSLVSLFYFVRPMFDTFGGNAIWAVMTVVVVFEFTVGATLSKGLNRICATLLAGFLGVGVSYVAELTAKNCQQVILGVSVFTLGAASTYSRFFPMIKRRYDYGMVIFILTFDLIAISGYRAENLVKMACQRMYTIVIGCALCFAINVVVFPVWAGDDLHNSILRNMEGLAESLEECVTKYFDMESKDNRATDVDEFTRACKYVLNSKATEESLANFATWEPPHGRFFFRYPWNLYLKIGNMTRHCAYCVEALNGFLNSQIQVPLAVRSFLKTPCIDVGRESTNILRELAESIRNTRRSKNAHLMMDRLRAMVEILQNSLRARPELFIDTKRWQIVEENPLKTPQNFLEGLNRTDKLHASSMPNRAKQADLINITSSRATLKEEEIQEDASSDRAGKVSEMGEMKQSSCVFMEALALASFSALLIEIVEKLKTVIMAVDKLGEEAIFKNTDNQVNESPPRSNLIQTIRSTSTKQIVVIQNL